MSRYGYSDELDETFSPSDDDETRQEQLGLYTCSECRTEDIDPIDSEPHPVNGEAVCQDCVKSCDGCGEYVDDATRKLFGPGVRYRQWETDGKLEDAHALCAAEHMLGIWTEDLTGDGNFEFDSDDYSKAQIAVIVEAAFTEAAK